MNNLLLKSVLAAYLQDEQGGGRGGGSNIVQCRGREVGGGG